MSVAVGDVAPDFTLKDQNNQEVTLSGFRGQKNVLIVFHPHAYTGNCDKEMCAIRDDIGALQNDDVQVLSVSCDSVFVHKAWAESQGYEFPMLADFWPHGAAAQAYGCFDEVGGRAKRASYLVDKEGVVRWLVVNPVPEPRDHADYAKALAAL